MAPSYDRLLPARQLWLEKVFFPSWLTQEALAFILIPILFNGGRELGHLIPHHDSYRPNPNPSNSTIGMVTGGTPEDIAPLVLAFNLYLTGLLVPLTVVISFIEMFSLKCLCGGRCMGPVAFASINIIQLGLWLLASCSIGSVLWEWERYMKINLLLEPIWWAAFLVQIIYALSFAVPAGLSIVWALRERKERRGQRAPDGDGERAPLLAVEEDAVSNEYQATEPRREDLARETDNHDPYSH